MAKYWASCSPGLEFALLAELGKLKDTNILQDASIFGGVVFSTLSAEIEILQLRAADNVYAFVGKFKGVPFEKDAAVLYLKDLTELADWDSSLDLFWRWKAYEAADSNAAVKFDKYTPLSFRVSCDRACVMKKKHGFTSMEAAAAVGEGVYQRFGWRADMCFYDYTTVQAKNKKVLASTRALSTHIQKYCRGFQQVSRLLDSKAPSSIYTTLTNRGVSKIPEHAREGLPSCSQELTKNSELEHNVESIGGSVQRSSRANRAESQLYAQRAYRKALVNTSLKPSVAHALLQLGSVVPGSVILDPMCGCGTIPLEAAEWFGSEVYCVGGDIATRAVNATFENLNASGTATECDILQWNASNLPMRSGVVDRIVCDMPFGNRCGTSRSRDSICPKVLREIVRILRVGTGVAVLLGQSKAVKHEVETTLKPFLRLLQMVSIQMEGLRVEILVLQRTEEPHQATHRKCEDKDFKK